MINFSEEAVRTELKALCVDDTMFHVCHPFGDRLGADDFFDSTYRALSRAWPDLERRDYIVMAGTDEHGADWVGCGGYYTGTFLGPWLDIPPTGHQVTMRFHEFFHFEDNRVVDVHMVWDIPEVMMQAGAWPMAPSLGREWHVPGPATQDGLISGPYDDVRSQASCQHIIHMLDHLTRHPAQGGPEVMEMHRFWHPRMNWYGPSGIGTARGISGFRHWHQIPFLNAMPDRGQRDHEIRCHFFGDGNYAAVTGWPNMIQTIAADGWLGIAPAGKTVSMRSLDFWRLEDGLIRENWVLVDLLDIYNQLGVDVFGRLREFNKARNMGSVNLLEGQWEGMN